jgi:hypothetical protein
MRIIVGLLAAVWFSSVAMASSVTARVDRESIVLNETFSLLVEAPGQGHKDPPLGALEKDFHVLGTSRGTRIVVRNGRTDVHTEWRITLMAKRSGELTIPDFEVADGRTQPVGIRVLELAARSDTTVSGPDVYIETEVSPQNPIVQGQITYIVRLFSSVEIREGTLSEPELADATVERLGRDVRYEARRKAQRYQVTERRFAIFPQASGELVISPTVFDGRVPENRDPSSNNLLGNRRGVFGADPFGSIFRPSRSIRRMGEQVTLTVRPRPDLHNGQAWLPAESLTIKEQWTSEPLQFRVGEPGTRTITVIARGLTAAQLPEFPASTPEGLKVYPDKPTLKTVTQGIHLVGTREQKFAIVPASHGVHLLPEVRIPWWNTKTERWEEAILPEKEITALPAAAPAPAAPAGFAEPRATGAGRAAFPRDLAAPGSLSSPWMWTTAALLIAWLATLALWWRSRTAAPGTGPATAQPGAVHRSSDTRRKLESACSAGQPAETRDALLRWGTERWGEHRAATLVSLARCVEQPDARAAIEELDRSLYLERGARWNGQDFLRRVACALDTTSLGDSVTSPQTQLPELYPSRGA